MAREMTQSRFYRVHGSGVQAVGGRRVGAVMVECLWLAWEWCTDGGRRLTGGRVVGSLGVQRCGQGACRRHRSSGAAVPG